MLGLGRAQARGVASNTLLGLGRAQGRGIASSFWYFTKPSCPAAIAVAHDVAGIGRARMAGIGRAGMAGIGRAGWFRG